MIMVWPNLLLSIYTLIALVFLDKTYREGKAAGGPWEGMRLLGLALCLFWPALFGYIVFAAYRDRRKGLAEATENCSGFDAK